MEAHPPELPEKLWHPGANYAADAVVITEQNSLLLIQRRDGQWALPGGFREPGETSDLAARRELFEETGLEINQVGTLIFSGRVDDPRSSDDRWIESDAYLFDNQEEVNIRADDDAIDTRWQPIDELPTVLYGSHGAMIEAALVYRQRKQLHQLLLVVARGSGV